MCAAWPVRDGDNDPVVRTLRPPKGELPKGFAVWPVMNGEEVSVLSETSTLVEKKLLGGRAVGLFVVDEKGLTREPKGVLVLFGTLEFPKTKLPWSFGAWLIVERKEVVDGR